MSRTHAPKSPNGRNSEVADLLEAAQYLKISKRTLQDYINDRRFGKDDGLRRVGGLVRIHMPTLIARFEAGTLMEHP